MVGCVVPAHFPHETSGQLAVSEPENALDELGKVRAGALRHSDHVPVQDPLEQLEVHEAVGAPPLQTVALVSSQADNELAETVKVRTVERLTKCLHRPFIQSRRKP